MTLLLKQVKMLLRPPRKNSKQTAEATGELIEDKIADKIVKPKPVPEAKPRYAKKAYIPPEQRQEKLNDLILI